jgi:hypothetical protein
MRLNRERFTMKRSWFSAPDLWAGLALMALAAAYYGAAQGIQRSLLADEVGAAGLPKMLAIALAVAGLLLAVRSQAASALRVTLHLTAQAAGLLALRSAAARHRKSFGLRRSLIHGARGPLEIRGVQSPRRELSAARRRGPGEACPEFRRAEAPVDT